MKLAHRDLGGEGNPPLVILHGLLGSSRNWSSTGKALASRYHVLAIDLRNHGSSPHAAEASIPTMAADVIEFLNEHAYTRATIMGHSLGGKVAMRIACDYPNRVERLVVLDIAPKAYRPDPTVLDAMIGLDLGTIDSRADAEAALEHAIPDQATRWFVLTNLVRDENGFRWQADLPVLRDHLEQWTAAPLRQGDRYDGPTRFVIGGRSSYASIDDVARARAYFPHATLEVIEDSGHNVHIEGGDDFVEAVG